MKLHLFLLCVTGLVPIISPIPLPASDFYFISEVLTWPNAQKYCRMKYTDLLRVNDKRVLLKLRELVASQVLISWPLWIGLYDDIDSWRWSFNNLPLTSTTLTNWKMGQPDNYQGKEACVCISGTGYWGDIDCASLKPFICYNAGKSDADKFVGVSSPQMTWSGAQSYCRAFHTDLASILHETDNALLAKVASVQGSSWFGLYREKWKWVNRTIASNLEWIPGEPDNSNPPETCASFYQGMFHDENCNARHYFLCELIPPVRSQIVKLQVKSDGSVLDPAVQSSILEQIKQKLKEKGMLNTTVTWRAQPDGNIFRKKKKNEL